MTTKEEKTVNAESPSEDVFKISLQVLETWSPEGVSETEKVTVRKYGDAISQLYGGSLVVSNSCAKLQEHVDYILDEYIPLLDDQNVDYSESMVTGIDTRWTQAKINQTFPEVISQAEDMRIVINALYTQMTRCNPKKVREASEFKAEVRGALMGKVKSESS